MADGGLGDRRQGLIYDFGFRNYDFLPGMGALRVLTAAEQVGEHLRPERCSAPWFFCYVPCAISVASFVLPSGSLTGR
jgi:hypothetical protein